MARGRSVRLSIEARAKINLGLEVIRRRSDGYHEIRSLMQTVGLADRLDLTLDREGALLLRCPGTNLPEGSGNLVLRAAELLRGRTGCGLGARIRLQKRIPIGAGLGGGSSNAAATLVALNRMWRLRLRRCELESLGAELGSDVPFFIRGGTQLAAGRGEKLRPLAALPRLPVLLIYPNLVIPTASVYGAAKMQLTPRGPLFNLRSCDLTTRSGVMSCLVRLRNDLEPAVVHKHPRIGEILQRVFVYAPSVARVSGSGSSIFVLGGDRATLRGILTDATVQTSRVILTQFEGRGWVFVVPRGAGENNSLG
jgi:4-diphosphocytidyl-2-C-methyl-D-erythritol kinase